jgi:site-specific DNA recombinase
MKYPSIVRSLSRSVNRGSVKLAAMTARLRRSTPKIIRAIIYARVSKDDGKRGRSPEEQIDSCTEDCRYEGWPVGETLEDNDRGASRQSKREREQWNRLPDTLRRGDVLVVWEPSRITRNMAEFSWFCDLLAERGVPVYYDGRLYDMDDDDDRNTVWQDILDGAKQVAKTRKRVLRAMTANLSDNRAHGKAAPGYEIIYERGESVGRRPVPAQRTVLRTAARRVMDQGGAVSMSALSRELEADWRAGGGTGAFGGRDLTRFLTNPTLFGYRIHDGRIAGKGTWEPVLDPEWYPSITAILTAADRLTHRGSEPKWLLTSIAQCGVCVSLGEKGKIDHKIHRSSRPSEKHADLYVCAEFSHVARNMKRVNDHVEMFLMQLLEREDAKALLLARDEEGQVSMEQELAQIDLLRRELDQYVRDAARTRMSATAVSVYVEQTEADIAAAQDRVNARMARVDPVLLELAGPGAWGRWKARTVEEKRGVLRSCLSVVIVPVQRRGRYSDVGVEVYPRGVLELG